MVSCLYISYLLLIFEYKIRESSLIVLTSLCLNWCLNQRKIGRVRYKKICLYVAVNQFLMLPWRCTWKNVAHLLWEQRVAGSNPVTPTENETVTKVAVFFYCRDFWVKWVVFVNQNVNQNLVWMLLYQWFVTNLRCFLMENPL